MPQDQALHWWQEVGSITLDSLLTAAKRARMHVVPPGDSTWWLRPTNKIPKVGLPRMLSMKQDQCLQQQPRFLLPCSPRPASSLVKPVICSSKTKTVRNWSEIFRNWLEV